jgi:CBS domain-containing protein
MSLKVRDLMAQGVVTARPDHTVDYVRRQMRTLEINAVPVADPDGKPLGIVRSGDFLVPGLEGSARVDQVMKSEAPTIEGNVSLRDAARLMIEKRAHHLLVTQDGKIVGMLSSFDFLELIATRRFEMVSDEPEFKTGIYQVTDPNP